MKDTPTPKHTAEEEYNYMRDAKNDRCYNRVLDKLDVALKELSKLKEERKWISVDTLLPKNNEQVLCYNGYRMVENSYSIGSDQDAEWFKQKFTHWQPLPEVPSTP